MSKTKTRGVYERDKGSGVWWIHWHDSSGKRHREKVGPKQLAIDAYRKRKTEVVEGKFFPELRSRGVLFEHLCDDFIKHKPDHWSKGMMAVVKAWFGPFPATSITPQMIDKKFHDLLARGRTPATANRYRAIIGVIYTWAFRNGKVTVNPARGVPLKWENNARSRYLTDDEEAELRKVLTPGEAAELTLAITTGMRRANQYGLRWADVDLKRGIITLQETKPGDRQYIPINTDCAQALNLLRSLNVGDRVCNFVSPRSWFERACAAAKIEDFRWHDLRHTFASRLTMAGRHPLEVKQLMGHKTLAMTERYSHLAPGRLKEAVEAISRAKVERSPEATARVPAKTQPKLNFLSKST